MIKINFRQYILEKKAQTKKDRKATKKDNKGKLYDYQKSFYDARIGLLEELYDDCKKYEWQLRIK